MEIISSFQSEVPICRQIAGEAGERLAAGRFPPGEQLPPGRKTAAPIGVNFKTVARAYRPLEGQGMISTPTGGGLSFPFRFPALIWRKNMSAGENSRRRPAWKKYAGRRAPRRKFQDESKERPGNPGWKTDRVGSLP